MKRATTFAFAFAAATLFSGPPSLNAQSPGEAKAREVAAAQLRELFVQRLAWQKQESPEAAMAKGDYSRADQIAEMSVAAIQRRHDATIDHLHRLQSIDRELLNESDRVNLELFELDLKQAVEGNRFRTFLTPVGGRSGPHQDIPQMAERVRFNTVADYENYLARLELVPRQVDEVIELLRTGLKEKRTPPQVTLLGVPGQFQSLLQGGGLNALADPFNRWPDDVDPASQLHLRERFERISFPSVKGAVAKLGEYFTKEYLPACRVSIAAKDWPEGEEFYNYQLKVMTTTDFTAQQIHELGLSEVKRIKAEMMQVIGRTDFLSSHPEAAKLDEQSLFNAFVKYLRTDPRFYYTSAEELMRGYRDICKQVDAWLPKFFHTLPRLPYGVKEIPSFMAPSQTTAYYQQGDIRNAEPGYFMVNTYQLTERPKYEMITLAIHEAVPGHHLQVALAQELDDKPEILRETWYTAFGEGWALYSERLAIEMGLLTDPYNDFGRLTYEMWRACRLVVDPGMHALGWTRDESVKFMLDNTALSELNIKTEVDRYIAWPGQATGYKIGELKIRALRADAEAALGDRFDIRAFHEAVLGAGHVPLNVLERRVREWIKSAQKAP